MIEPTTIHAEVVIDGQSLRIVTFDESSGVPSPSLVPARDSGWGKLPAKANIWHALTVIDILAKTDLATACMLLRQLAVDLTPPNVGDTVRLRSGGPEMTVKLVGKTKAWCTWGDGEHEQAEFVFSLLMTVTK